VATLGFGPLHALRTGQPLINNLQRRDLGIWAALAGLVHLGLATREVMQPAYFSKYVTGTPTTPMPAAWTDWVSTGSIVGGYAVGLIFVVLLGLSNNLSLRRLGIGRWKKLQGIATVAFALTAAHGATFQLIEGRTGSWPAGLVVLTIAVLVLRRHSRRAVAAAQAR
jgi:DMSO/TMAO reductase YedYZ heme-binding membrane subunit